MKSLTEYINEAKKFKYDNRDSKITNKISLILSNWNLTKEEEGRIWGEIGDDWVTSGLYIDPEEADTITTAELKSKLIELCDKLGVDIRKKSSKDSKSLKDIKSTKTSKKVNSNELEF